MKVFFVIGLVSIALLFPQSDLIAQTETEPVESFEISTTVLDYGVVPLGSSEVNLVTITNTGTVDLIVGTTVEGGASSSFRDFGLFILLSPNSSGDVGAFFEPTANGDSTDVLDVIIYFDDDSEDEIENNPTEHVFVDLIGTGGAPTEPSALVEFILTILDEAVAEGSLTGRGNGTPSVRRLSAMRNRIGTVDFLIDQGHNNAARHVTQTLIRRSDGEGSPPDFVEEGPATTYLNELFVMLEMLIDN